MRLAVGTVVAYPPHGVGRIAGREQRVVLGVVEEVVLIELSNDLLVTLPLSRAPERLRLPVSEDGLRRIRETLREDAVVSEDVWAKRLQQAQEKLRRGDPEELAEIVRDGARRQQTLTGKGTPFKLSTSERALHLKAREFLSSEIGFVLGIGQMEADVWIDEQLELGDG